MICKDLPAFYKIFITLGVDPIHVFFFTIRLDLREFMVEGEEAEGHFCPALATFWLAFSSFITAIFAIFMLTINILVIVTFLG
jgi:uncharacterized membrane protein